MKKFFYYWNTIKYLKFSQTFGRIFFYLYVPKIKIKTNISLRSKTRTFRSPILRKSSLKAPYEFKYFNQTGNIIREGWESKKKSKLWLYNLHYFDYLNSCESSEQTHLLKNIFRNWIRKNKNTKGIAWDSYPTSLRIVNIIKWFLSTKVTDRELQISLASQTLWLEKRIEFHLLGNHLIANAKALIFSGLFFSGRDADRWASVGCKILTKQIEKQILQDGAHCELSPMYHAIILEDFLDLINVMKTYNDSLSNELKFLKEALLNKIPKMHLWLKQMCHPDGQIAFFNDATFGVASTLKDLRNYAEILDIAYEIPKLNSRYSLLKDSGYVLLKNTAAYALLDVGRLGQDFLLGHAHADTLSFELSLFKKRFLVNLGVSTYEISKLRSKQRGSAFHNTLTIDNENSSEVWSSFRVAKRAYPRSFNHQYILDGENRVCCSHDGYKRLRGRPIHRRCWVLSEKSFVVEDKLDNAYERAVIFFHFHPQVKNIKIKNNNYVNTIFQGRNIQIKVDGGKVNLVKSEYFPFFGTSVGCVSLEVRMTSRTSKLSITWE